MTIALWGGKRELASRRIVPSGKTSQSWHRLHARGGVCISVCVLQCYFCVYVWVKVMSRALQISVGQVLASHAV